MPYNTNGDYIPAPMPDYSTDQMRDFLGAYAGFMKQYNAASMERTRQLGTECLTAWTTPERTAHPDKWTPARPASGAAIRALCRILRILAETRTVRLAPTTTLCPLSSRTPDYASLLRMYGVQTPDIRQSPIFSNNFMQAHPQLGGALNNALMSAALTPGPRGPEGWGEGLSRALQGVMGVQPAMRQFQFQQQAAPIQYATELAKLYGSQAQADMYAAHADYFRQMPGERLEAAQLRALAAQQKLGQPIHKADGSLLGYMTPEGFKSAASLGIPDDASVAKPGAASGAKYDINAYTHALINDAMTKKYGSDQSKWPDQVPIAMWNRAISQAQNAFKVAPAEAINDSRQADINARQQTNIQMGVQRMLETEKRNINARYDKQLNDPLVKYDDKKKAELESQRQSELQDAATRYGPFQDSLIGPQQGANVPGVPRKQPVNVPAGQAVLYDPQGAPHSVDARLVDQYLASPQYKGWHK